MGKCSATKFREIQSSVICLKFKFPKISLVFQYGFGFGMGPGVDSEATGPATATDRMRDLLEEQEELDDGDERVNIPRRCPLNAVVLYSLQKRG
jgi:hypothetical protein